MKISNSRQTFKRSGGFTLLEVMISVIVFAMMASMISQVTSTNIGNHVHLENKVMASWIAENETIELRSVPWAEIKNKSKDLESANRKWLVKNNVVEKKDFMGVPGLIVKEVSISVALNETPDSPLQTYVSYMANDDA